MHLRKQADKPQAKYTPPEFSGVKKESLAIGSNRYLIDICRCGGMKRKCADLCWSCWMASKRPPIDNDVYTIEGKKCRKVPLTRNRYAIVNRRLYGWIMQWSWIAWKGDKSGNLFYAATSIRKNGKTQIVMMHNLIADRFGIKIKDHKNRNPLDNRVSNLRSATYSQNSANHRRQSNNKSGFNGVFWNRHDETWVATITVRGRKMYIGRSDSKIDAARLHDIAARKYFGEFAVLNLPNDVQADSFQPLRRKLGRRPKNHVGPRYS